MENTDNILNEMQQQLRQMKEKLEGETIVNEKLLRNAYRKTLGSLQRKALRQTIIGIVAMLLSLNLLNIGFSIPFVIATEVMLAFCLAATIIINNRLPKMDTDLVTAAKGSYASEKATPTGSGSEFLCLSSGWAEWSMKSLKTRHSLQKQSMRCSSVSEWES